MKDNNDQSYTRREFITRSAKASLSIAAVTATGYLLHDSDGPARQQNIEGITHLPDYRVSPISGKNLSIVSGTDRIKTVNHGLQLLGGIDHFIKEGDIVGIKPNIGFASPSLLGATSDPDLVGELIRLCYQVGKASKVLVFDNPINDPAACFQLSGIEAVCRKAGAQPILPRDHYFGRLTLDKAKLIRDWPVFLQPLSRINKLIGIAPVKHHHRSGASMSIKNWYGLLGGRRNIFHQDIHTIIGELAMMVRPTLVILDGTRVMATNGPTGGALSDLRQANTMIVGSDPVSVDSFGCSLLGLKPDDLPFLGKAERLGAGILDFQSLKPLYGKVS